MIPTKKQRLRSEIRSRLALWPPAEAGRETAIIWKTLTAHPAWARARTVFAFAPTSDEPNILDALFASGKILALPRTDGVGMECFRVRASEDLTPGRFGLMEPRVDCERLPAGHADLVLVPGLAFDQAGGRLGRGGGFYDRFLARPELHAVTIGVAFSIQIVPRIPVEEHDRRVDAVISAPPRPR